MESGYGISHIMGKYIKEATIYLIRKYAYSITTMTYWPMGQLCKSSKQQTSTESSLDR